MHGQLHVPVPRCSLSTSFIHQLFPQEGRSQALVLGSGVFTDCCQLFMSVCCTSAILDLHLQRLTATPVRLQSLESLKLKEIKNGAEHPGNKAACCVIGKPFALLSTIPTYTCPASTFPSVGSLCARNP